MEQQAAAATLTAGARRRPPIARASSYPETFRIQKVETEEGLTALATAWEGLHRDAVVASMFTSWSWQRAWWAAYGGGRSLSIMAARRGDELAGLLPLYLETGEALGLPLRTLRVIGCGGDTSPDDLGAVLAPGIELQVARALADAILSRTDFDVLEVADLDDASAFGPALLEAAGRAGFAWQRSGGQRILYADLPAKPRRVSLRRKLETDFGAKFYVWSDATRIAEALATLADLHRRRWGERSTSFATEPYMALQRTAMSEWMARGWLRLYCLDLEGKPAAMAYCCRFRERVYMLQAGFDPAHARWSPGSAVLAFALEDANREGVAAFDFLRGQHGYKEELATGVRHTVSYTIYRRTIGAMAARAKLACVSGMRRKRA
jgi:CelD/BcsL family acetyltransferase involved in cellulose biosynthesis